MESISLSSSAIKPNSRMSNTPSKPEKLHRVGTINLADAGLYIWEEPGRAAMQEPGWDEKFKRDVFARIIKQLHQLGWKTSVSAEKTKNYSRAFALNHRDCVKGDLHAELSINGRCAKFEMFQNVNAPDRPEYGGRYQSNKEQHAPYLMRLEMYRTRNRIANYLVNVLGGYKIKPQEPSLKNGASAMEVASYLRKTSGHYVPELDSARPSDQRYLISGDNMPLANGVQVYALTNTGKVITGKAFYSLNGNWQVVSGNCSLIHVWHKQLFVNSPGNLRTKRNQDIRRKRLEAEMSKAVAAMNFERAAALRDVLFPDNQPLFMIWSRRNDAYYRAGSSGYTQSIAEAGKFTAAEIGINTDSDLKIIPVANHG